MGPLRLRRSVGGRYSEEEAARGAEEWFHSGLGLSDASARIEEAATQLRARQAAAATPSAPSAPIELVRAGSILSRSARSEKQK